MSSHQRGRGARLRAWVWLVSGLVLYGTVVGALLVIEVGTAAPRDPLLPDWAPLVLAPVLYAVLALAAFARVSLLGALGATCALCGLRVFLGIVSAVLDSAISLTPFSDALVDAFDGVSLLTLLGLASPPLLLLPFGRVGPRARWARAQARNSARAGHAAARAPERVVEERPAPGSTASAEQAPPESQTPAASARDREARPPSPAIEQAPVESRPSLPVALVSAPTMPAPTVESENPASAAATPASTSASGQGEGSASAVEAPPAPKPPAAESVGDVVRISFARVAAQLPTNAFRLPTERVAAGLMDAGHLLVPVHVVAPQLGEGLVQVAWSVVAEQFPRQALALSDADIASRLANGSIVLPLDEVVRQIPSDLFALSSPTVDVRGIEDFPPPFQPHFPQPSKEAGRETAPASPSLNGGLPAAPRVAAPLASEAVPVQTAPTPAATPSPPPRAADIANVPPVGEPALTLERLAVLMRDLRAPLDVGIREVDGVTLFTVVPAGVSVEAIVATAARVLPCLDAGLAEPLEQMTLRAAETVLVLTPLGSRAPYDALVAAALPVGAPLALLEQQALRAAASLPRPAMSGRMPELARAPRVDLHEVAVPPHVRAIAESLRGFGALSPVVLTDATGTPSVYLFLPAGLEPRALGALAGRLQAALSGAEIGPLISIVLRLGGRRVVVRSLDVGRGLLVAAAPGERPGLVRLEVERAAGCLVERGA